MLSFDTTENFKQQNLFWEDDYYLYSVHVTDGGAIYLAQVEKIVNQETGKAIDQFTDDMCKEKKTIIRLDGTDFKKLIEHLKTFI